MDKNLKSLLKNLDNFDLNLCSEEEIELISKFKSFTKSYIAKISELKNKDNNLEAKNFELPNIKETNIDYYLFSDGGCRGNPGPGAYYFLVQDNNGETLFDEGAYEVNTTNNRMELKGVIFGLKKILDLSQNPSDNKILICSDSKYVLNGLETWMNGWKKRGWKKADNKAPENVELWQELDRISESFKEFKFLWVKGHSGHPQNEFCDQNLNRLLDENV